MTYRIWGRLDGERVSATWTDEGRLEGDAVFLHPAAELVTRGARVAVTPTGPAIEASLDDGWSALVTLSHLIDWGGVEGDVPEPPPGAPRVPSVPGRIY